MDDPRLSDPAYCGCAETDVPAAPGIVWNRPSLPAIAWRIGTFAGLRGAESRELTAALPALTTREGDDHAITLIELWAALADVLTFYGERIANEAYLRTAIQRDSVRRLTRLLDYKPHPGLAAETRLAFTLDPGATLTLKAGLRVMSVPGQDETPQIFETLEEVAGDARLNRVRAIGLPSPVNPFAAGSRGGLLLSGPERLVPADRLLLCGAQIANGRVEEKVVASAAATPDGRRLAFDPPVQGGALGTAVRIRRDLRLFGWNAPATQVLYDPGQKAGTAWTRAPSWVTARIAAAWPDVGGWVPLEAKVEGIKPGALLAVHRPGSSGVVTVPFIGPGGIAATVALGQPVALARVTEVADRPVALSAVDPATNAVLSPQPAGVPSDTVTCVKLRPEPAPSAGLSLPYPQGATISPGDPRETRLWEVEEPAVLFLGWTPPASISGPSVAVRAADLRSIPVKRSVILTDGTRTHRATVAGSAPHVVNASQAATLLRIDLDPPIPAGAPLDGATTALLGNVALAGHGEMQAEDIIGDGNGARAFQRLRLRKAPVTRRAAAGRLRGVSDLIVLVDNEAWTEVPTLFGRGAAEKVYVLEEGEDGTSWVRFGDGVTGRRLPSGSGNVRARYRVGLGLAGQVRAAQLSIPLIRPPGLREAANPEAASGAADPEAAETARQNAPRHVRTFGRIVALSDIEALAVESGLAAAARADWVWSGIERVAHLSALGPDGAMLSAGALATLAGVLNAARDRTVRLVLGAALRVNVQVVGRVFIDNAFVREEVIEACRTALLDRFAFLRVPIAGALHLSDVQAAVQAVRGVLGIDVDAFRFRGQTAWTPAQRQARDLSPGSLQPHLRLFPARPAAAATGDPVAAAAYGAALPRLLPAEQAALDTAGIVLTATGGIA